MRTLSIFVIACSAIALAACGSESDTDGPGEAEQNVTADVALSEIRAVRAGLTEGLTQYKAGDDEAAERTVGDAYLEHFELVEVPLAKADPQLNEDLEHLMREELRGAIADGSSPKRVAALVREARAGLTEAEQALRKAG